jgi:hypothetical protein
VRLFAAGFMLLLTGALVAQTPAHAWPKNLTRAQVLAALGEPDASMKSPDGREWLMYKNDLKIELSNGVVTNITGTVPDALKTLPPVAATVAAATAPAASAPAPVSPVTVKPAMPAAAASAPAASAAPAASGGNAVQASENAAPTDQDSEKIISDFSNTGVLPPGFKMPSGAPGDTGTLPGGIAMPGVDQTVIGSVWSQPNNIAGFLAGLALRTAVMTVVLKLVFAYKDFPVIWQEVALVAFGVSLVNEILAWVFTFGEFGKLAAMLQVDQLFAGFLLLALIMNCTQAKQFPTAAGITVSAMAANIALSYAILFFF